MGTGRSEARQAVRTLRLPPPPQGGHASADLAFDSPEWNGDLLGYLLVVDADGQTYRFKVIAREVYDKDRIPLGLYFARDGDLRLTLITCGGEFDRDAGRYRDNVVVTALPAD